MHAATTKDRIFSEKKLTAGIHNGKPWGYRTPDGKVEGFNVDIIRAAFEPLGVTEFNFVTGDFGSLIPSLISNRFDLVDSGIVITEERCKRVSFGDPKLTTQVAQQENEIAVARWLSLVTAPCVVYFAPESGHRPASRPMSALCQFLP